MARRERAEKTCVRGEQGNLPEDEYHMWVMIWIKNPEAGNVRSDVQIPCNDEIYAQIAFQEQYFSGVLLRKT